MLPALRPDWIWARYTKGDPAMTPWSPTHVSCRTSKLSEVTEGWPGSGDLIVYTMGDDGLAPGPLNAFETMERIP